MTCPEGFGTPGHFPARIDVAGKRTGRLGSMTRDARPVGAPVVVVDGPDKDKFELEAAFNS